MAPHQVVYVTGAPASGKTTLIKHLTGLVAPLKSLEYGDRLLDFLRRDNPNLTRDELRKRSSELVTPALVAHLDDVLVEILPNLLETTHVVIGSHAVTHERFGVRITAFGQRHLQRLPLSAVVVLDCPPDQLVKRIAAKSEGRIWRTVDEADRLQRLQIKVALHYGIICGCPVLVIDSKEEPETLASTVLGVLQSDGIFGKKSD